MGIKFLCEHCGKNLNVKAFLAGKRGICPECGKKIAIPKDHVSDSPAPEHAGSTTSQQGPQAVGVAAAVGAGAPATATIGASPAGTPTAIPTNPQGATGAPVANVADPIASAPPNAAWYVRPATGGQYGPANGEQLRAWVKEGRVAADSLIWREGLANWQPANQLLPQVNAATAKPVVPVGSQAAEPNAAPDPFGSPPPTSRYRFSRRKSNALMISILVFLGIMTVTLIFGLVYLIMR